MSAKRSCIHAGTRAARFMRFYDERQDEFHQDRHALVRRLARRNVRYGALPTAFEMAPILVDGATRTRLAAASEAVLRAAEWFSRLACREPAWLDAYPWPRPFRDLVLCPPGYSLDIPCSRLDAFILDDRIVFLELNTDGSSYMAYADVFHEEYRAVVAQHTEAGMADAACDAIMPGVLDALLGCYAEFRAQHPEAGLPAQPVIGIMDWRDEPTSWEFNTLAHCFGDQGVESHVVAPGQASFDGRTLSFDGRAVHLIYRRLLGTDYAARQGELDAVTAAFTRRAVCMVGAPRSQIAFSKKLFAFLRDPRVRAGMPDDCAAAVDAHIPWTCVLAPARVDVHGEQVDLIPFLRANRDGFVLKPCEGKLGAGIYVGRFMDQKEWDAAINEAVRADYIAQEFVAIPTAQFPRFRPRQNVEQRYLHLGAYVFGGKFRGLLGRTCAHAVLNARHGERLTAVMAV